MLAKIKFFDKKNEISTCKIAMKSDKVVVCLTMQLIAVVALCKSSLGDDVE